MHITLQVVKLHGDESRQREITLPISQISVEDWFSTDKAAPVPNHCKVFANGQAYKVKLSRKDLEKAMEEAGAKIIKPKILNS